MKSTAALLLAVSLAACETPRMAPPAATTVKVAVPTPCSVPEPECRTPDYDQAKKGMPGDARIRLLRAETIGQQDCLRRYREALATCRK